jgi:hypothetical protein
MEYAEEEGEEGSLVFGTAISDEKRQRAADGRV